MAEAVKLPDDVTSIFRKGEIPGLVRDYDPIELSGRFVQERMIVEGKKVTKFCYVVSTAK